MNQEEYFFRYAFPCSQTLLQLKRISEEDYDSLEKWKSRISPLVIGGDQQITNVS